MRSVRPYSVLAGGYDFVMRHVDYASWATYIQGLITDFNPEAVTMLELGCGTGRFGVEMCRLGPYRYHGTDISPEMVACARLRAAEEEVELDFQVADFTGPAPAGPYDVVMLLYDGINYCLEPQLVLKTLHAASKAVAVGGLFLLDQSTPANSAENEAFFEDDGESGSFNYRRNSAYDEEAGLHRTIFDLSVDGKSFREEHVQRAYTVKAMREMLGRTMLREEACLDGFGRSPATEASHRVQWVLRKPAAAPTLAGN